MVVSVFADDASFRPAFVAFLIGHSTTELPTLLEAEKNSDTPAESRSSNTYHYNLYCVILIKK